MDPLSMLYSLGYRLSRAAGLRRRRRLPCRVISIGNLTVGGTGKTPVAIAMAREAQRRGYRPVILTRGYRGAARGPCFVSTGDGPLVSVGEAGDEPFLMAERTRGVAVVKGADRYASGVLAIERLDQKEGRAGEILFILDDGYQHWPLYRDRDVLLIDGRDPFGGGRLLPLGRLREPLEALARADIIVVTKTGLGQSMEDIQTISLPHAAPATVPAADTPDREGIVGMIRGYNRTAPVFLADHAVTAVRLLSGDRMPPGDLRERRVLGFCGLADPGAFRRTLLSLGADVVGMVEYRDHHHFRAGDIARVLQTSGERGADWIATTEKDFVKVRNLDLPANIIIIEIEFACDRGFFETAFDW